MEIGLEIPEARRNKSQPLLIPGPFCQELPNTRILQVVAVAMSHQKAGINPDHP
jgi:hypothetical protein